MKIFIISCHSSLEYDQAMMFLRMGHQVAGSFDVGSSQKPKIKGCTDVSHSIEDAYKEADMLVLHQVEDYATVFARHVHAMYPRPVVLTYFGQGCEEQHRQVVVTLRNDMNAFVVCYSHKEEKILSEMGVPSDKVKMIRFGKDLSEFGQYGGWTGWLPICFMSCNSLKKRGEPEGGGMSWNVAKELIDSNLPLVIGGKESLELSCGIGELSWDALRSMYRQARCYLSLGTKPAPYVLTIVEAMCTGTPTIAYDNGCGIADEGLGCLVAHSKKEVFSMVKACMDIGHARCLSKKMIVSSEAFNMETVAQQWAGFMEKMI